MWGLAKPSGYGILNWTRKLTSIISEEGSCLKYLYNGIIQKSNKPKTFFFHPPSVKMDEQEELLFADYMANLLL